MGKAKYCEINNPMPSAVPELQRKKQERADRLAKALTATRAARKTEVTNAKADWLARGKAHHENWNAEQKRLVDARRSAQAEGNVFVPAQPKVLLVCRVKGINKVAPKQRLILRLLRLRQLHNATFVKVNKASLSMLQKVSPYITWGIPSRRTVTDLIYKRGYGKVNRQRVRLSDNNIVGQNLGAHNVVCMEDVVDTILNCGPAFKAVNNFLWPFKLNTPKGGYTLKTKSYLNGGVTGNREAYINQWVQKMI